jgi:murein tripeptide amidase MpaA
MTISDNFDAGNINCLAIKENGEIDLEIKKDNNSDFLQWFYFKLTGAKNKACKLNILNASKTSYSVAWHGYNVLASYDRHTWFRVDSSYDQEIFSFEHKPLHDVVYYAYFTPYSMEQHHDLIAKSQMSSFVEYSHLGYTLDGQDMDLLKIGKDEKNKKICWLIARQHPGETMAQWWMEGMLETLLDEENPISRELLKKAVFYVVPNMNPDGSVRGNLRTNAAGANLNREWLDASMQKSPEVFLVRQKMTETGMDFCLDVHGDEELPYNFIDGPEGIPSWNDERQKVLDCFQESLVKASPDFQTKIGYEKDAFTKEMATVGTHYMAETFNALVMTLEMPFKDTIETPNIKVGWSAKRSKELGKASLNAIFQTIDKI